MAVARFLLKGMVLSGTVYGLILFLALLGEMAAAQ